MKFRSAPAPLGFGNFDGWFTKADGTVDTQAGSHPYELTIALSFSSGKRTYVLEYPSEYPSGGEARDLVVNLPPGIVGDPGAVPQCTRREFDGSEGANPGEHCPADSQIGFDTAELNGGIMHTFPLYNLVPPAGMPAQFAFNFEGISTFLDAGVRTGGDNGVSDTVDNVAQRALSFNTTTIWGDSGGTWDGG